MGNPDRLFNPAEWCTLQEKIRLKYPLEDDKKMFDAILNGMSIKEALKIGSEKSGEDIELF